MKPFSLSQKVNAERFQQVFERRVPSNYMEIDYNEVYGTADRSGFTFYVKPVPRSFLSCIAECLRVEIDTDGTVRCRYKRTLEALILGVFAPIFALTMSVLCITVFHEPYPAFGCVPLAIIFALFNCFKSKSLRQQLLDAVSQVADEAKQS
ncbi:MAG: hypothetical protein J6R82_05455 [Clostridia bacterium]|nr:hypothetical protein [Clostridia bacterium]